MTHPFSFGNSMRNYQRLEEFLNKRFLDIYVEPIGEPHTSIIKMMISKTLKDYSIKPGAKILDVGCGQGAALQEFRNAGFDPVGICFGEEAKMNSDNGFKIIETDMSFLDIDSLTYDLIWCRHVIEHSIFPYFTISEMYRILNTGGVFYMEVPSAASICKHEENPNHYSVHTKEMWTSLLKRSGFSKIHQNEISFESLQGDDIYYCFTCTKG